MGISTTMNPDLEQSWIGSDSQASSWTRTSDTSRNPKLDTLVMYSARTEYMQTWQSECHQESGTLTEHSRTSSNPVYDQLPRKVSAWVVHQHSALELAPADRHHLDLGPCSRWSIWETETVSVYCPSIGILWRFKPTVVSADTSCYSIEGALLQHRGQQLVSVPYCSKILAETEKRCGQIEKEPQAGVWTCEKTDHKPLLPVINSRDLDKAPIRCQRLVMWLVRFLVTAESVSRKDLAIADMLLSNVLKGQEALDNEENIDAYFG